MAFDGTVIHALAQELSNKIINSRISKISQPEKDEIILTIRNSKNEYKLMMSANASLPLICFIDKNKKSNDNAPAFCMLLRKYILNGKIISISQIDFERAIKIKIEHKNEMGDLSYKYLIMEIMGKHSNIMLIDDKNTILDGIKRITPDISSVRMVLPGSNYFIPTAKNKINPLITDEKTIIQKIINQKSNIVQAIYNTISGTSPMISKELCYLSDIDMDILSNMLNDKMQENLINNIKKFFSLIKNHEYNYNIYYDIKKPVDFTVFNAKIYSYLKSLHKDSILDTLREYYLEKAQSDRLYQKSSNLRQLTIKALAKNINKLNLQKKQLNDTKKCDKFKLYGELLNAYFYEIPKMASFYDAKNYYDNNNKIRIPLDSTLSASQNAVKYFDKYQKLKRTFEALNKLIPETQNEITYLNTIAMYLDKLKNEEEITALKDDMIKNGFINKNNTKLNNKKKKNNQLSFLHYITKMGRDIFVGRNNIQNDELTFKIANKNDWWFHAKNIPGSHVILKNDHNDDIADEDFEDAARLAAYYSSSTQEKIEVDYIQKKYIIKPPSTPSGFVIYHKNYSMNIDNDISHLTLLN